MPRLLRLQYPGAMYHLMSRGDRQEKIILDDVDRQDFIKTLAEACQKTSWQVHAYCLLPYKTEEALAVLRDSARGKDLAALAALTTMARWERGDKGMWQELGRAAKKCDIAKFKKN